jgi:hypothetical protein
MVVCILVRHEAREEKQFGVGPIACACVRGVTVVTRWCYGGGTVVLQCCYSIVTVLLQCGQGRSRRRETAWSWADPLCMCTRRHSGDTVVLQWCYSVVTVLLQCCYSVVTVWSGTKPEKRNSLELGRSPVHVYEALLVVSVLLQCCYTRVTLLLHCCYTAYVMVHM